MPKPLGFYTSFKTGDCSAIESAQEQFGTQLQNCSRREKYFLISVLASALTIKQAGDCRNDIFKLGYRLQTELSEADQAGLLEALIDYANWGQNAETLHHT